MWPLNLVSVSALITLPSAERLWRYSEMQGDAGRYSGELAEIQASGIARLVDRDRLLERLSGGARLRGALGAGEVDEVDPGGGARGLAVRLRELLHLGRYREIQGDVRRCKEI